MSEAQKSWATEALRQRHTEESVKASFERMRPIFHHHFAGQTTKLNTVIRQFFADQFVYCLSEDSTNLLLWSHYANKHQGAVIRFECIDELENVFLAAKPVNYSDAFPAFGTKEQWIAALDGNHSEYGQTLYNDIITTKSKDWSYEREWRVVIPMPEHTGKDYGSIALRPPEVSEVILGCNMHSAEREALCTLVRTEYPNAGLYQARMSTDTFALEFEAVD